VPYPIEVNDTRGIIWYHYTAEEFADMIVDQFDEMLRQSARPAARVPDLAAPVRLRAARIRIRRLRRGAAAHPRASATASG
jgi:hypothetical protein